MPLYLPNHQLVGIKLHSSGTKFWPSSKCTLPSHPLLRAQITGVAHSTKLHSKSTTVQEVSTASDALQAVSSILNVSSTQPVSAASNFKTSKHLSNTHFRPQSSGTELTSSESAAVATVAQQRALSSTDPFVSQDFTASTTLIPSLSRHASTSPVVEDDAASTTTTTTVITTTITTTTTVGTSNQSVVTTSVSIHRDSVSPLDEPATVSSSNGIHSMSLPSDTPEGRIENSNSSIHNNSSSSINSSDSIASTNSSNSSTTISHQGESRTSADAIDQHRLTVPSAASLSPASPSALQSHASTSSSAHHEASSLPDVSSLHKADQQPASQDQPADPANAASLWALFMLFMSYVHQSASGSAVPAMLPVISPDLHLSDFQGALLTSGYSYLYAIALIPVGLAADKTSRPLLLSAGLTLWSTLTMKMGQVHDFNELLMARVGFAAAQATQNPISFALIPELFPKNKTTALAVYNCAIYLGRALSFAAVMLARAHPAVPVVADQITAQMLPLDQLDLQKTSLLFTQGNMAAVLPIYDYNYQVIEYGPVPEAAWRHLLWCFGVPGLLIAGLLAFTVREPRSKVSTLGAEIKSDSESDSDTETELVYEPELASAKAELAPAKPAWSVASVWSSVSARLGMLQGAGVSWALAGQVTAAAPAEMGIVSQTSTPAGRASPVQLPSFQLPGFDVGPLAEVWKIPAFRAVTFAAAMNDVGSYALIAWHSTFYERVFHLDSSIYAPLLATVMPIGGIIGGVGGGFLADHLDKKGGRAWMTVGASLLAAPFMAESLLAPSYQISFLALLGGFAMSEAWRSPSAIMIRSIAPTKQASTATALYICIRNLLGGTGPLAVAKLAEQVGLQKALLLAPACYLTSGLLFLVAEHMLAQRTNQTSSPDPQA